MLKKLSNKTRPSFRFALSFVYDVSLVAAVLLAILGWLAAILWFFTHRQIGLAFLMASILIMAVYALFKVVE